MGRVVRSYSATAATGASTGTAVDNGASSSGVAGYLQWQCASAAGAQEANIRILDSPDNITYSTLITFTKVGAVAGAGGQTAERITTTGFAQRYIAADFTTATATGGTLGNHSYMAGIVRGLSS